jgi:hypothetical protein
MTATLTLPEFIARWQAADLSERSAAQQHFLDLCAVLGQPTPAAVDQTGAFYTFEKGVAKTGGGQGFADVWLRGHFAWEYKGKHKNLAAASHARGDRAAVSLHLHCARRQAPALWLDPAPHPPG